MNVALLAWTHRELEQEVRFILRQKGSADLSTAACKAWVRGFIQERFPTWPRRTLHQDEVELLGAAYNAYLAWAKRDR